MNHTHELNEKDLKKVNGGRRNPIIMRDTVEYRQNACEEFRCAQCGSTKYGQHADTCSYKTQNGASCFECFMCASYGSCGKVSGSNNPQTPSSSYAEK